MIQKLTNKSLEEIDYEVDLKKYQDYLFELYLILDKIAKIDNKLDHVEIEAVFEGFKRIYKSIKIKLLETEMVMKI